MGFGDFLGMFGGSGGMNMPVSLGQMAPSPQPGIQSANFGALPQMSNPSASPFSLIGNALMKSNQGQTQQPQVQQAYAPPQAPIDMSLLQQLIASLGRR